MTANDFVSVDKIIAEVSQAVNDKDFKKGFVKGWFISRAHDALQELAFDTFYLKITMDYDLPEILQLKMPEDGFNIRELYLYDGERCNPNNTQNVYWKRLFNNQFKGEGYSAKVKDGGSNNGDPFVQNQRSRFNNRGSFSGQKYYYNVENGLIMFSTDCQAYPFVRIVFNAMGGVDGSLPTVPRFFHRAVVDYIEERYYNAMKSRDPRTYRGLWSESFQKLNDLRTGSWAKARKRVSSMDSAEKESMEEYLSSMYHK